MISQTIQNSATTLTKLSNNRIKLESPVSELENNKFEIKFSESNVQILDNGKLLKSVAIETSKQNQFEVFGGGGDDLLSVDLANSNFPFYIKFDGQNNFSGTVGDALEIKNGNAENAVYYYYNKTDGLIELDDSKIEYFGLEPIIGIAAANATLNMPNTSNNAVLSDSTNPGELELTDSGATFENTIFPFPTSSLTFNGGDMADELTINDLGTLPTSITLTFDGGAGNDVLIIDAMGETYTDNGTSIQITGSYTYNYTSFETVTVNNGTLLSGGVPTLSEWGLIILALLLMTLGALYLVQPKWRNSLEQE
ncbi:MAG: IPTL-CTERM sorting domain-containing protein [Chitinophagales bacterium]